MAVSKLTKVWFLIAVAAVLGVTLAAVIYLSVGRTSIARGYAEAAQAFQRGNFDESIRLLTQVVARDRSNEEAYRMLAQAAHKTGDFPLAVRSWSQAAYLNPLDKTLPINRDKERMTAGMYPILIDSLQSKIANKTASPEEIVLYAEAQLRTGDVGKAEEAAATLSPTFQSPERELLSADMDFARERTDEAKKRYGALTQNTSDILRAQGYLGLAAVAARAGNTQETIDLLLEASKQNPYVAGLPLGRFYMSQGEFEKAKLPLQRGIKAFGSLEGMVDLAEVYASLRDTEALRVLAQSMPSNNRVMAETAYYFEAILDFINSDTAAMRQKLELCSSFQARPLYRLMALQAAVALGDPAGIREAADRLVVSANTPTSRERIIRLLTPAFIDAVKNKNLPRAEGLARTLLSIAQPASEAYLSAQSFLMTYELARGDFSQARKFASEILRKHPDNAAATEVLAQALLTSAPAQSLTYFDRLHRASPKEARFLEGMALANAALGHNEKAEALMRELWQLAPQSPQNILTYGQFLLLKKRWEQLGALNDELTKSAQPKIQALGDYLRAQAAEIKGDKTAAIAAYRACVDKDPAFTAAWLTLSSLQPPSAGIDTLRESLVRIPGNIDLSYRLALLLAQENRNREAADIYEGLLKQNPKAGPVMANLSEVLAALGESERALTLAKQAYDLYPQWPVALECYGIRLLENKDYTAAIDMLTLALQAQPKNARVKNALVSALREAGKKAVQRGDTHLESLYFTRLKELVPNDPEAAQVLKRLAEEAQVAQAKKAS